jgi:hypothetical protein
MKSWIAKFAFVLLCVSFAANAEKARASRGHGLLRGHELMFGVDTDFAIPMGNYADASSVGAGIAVTAEYTLLETLSATMRVGFEAHTNRSVGALDSRVHAVPVLLGTKYYLASEREGLFGAFELGMFDLMSSVTTTGARGATTTASSNDLKFGLGAGLGYQQDRWNIRIALHTQDVGNFGDAFVLTGGLGYEFAGL